MKKKEQIKIIKKLKNKKTILQLIIQIWMLIILVGTIITGIFFSINNFKYSYRTGIAYSGGYQIQIDVFNKNSPNFLPDIPNGDSKKGLKLLKNKLDPLSNQNLYLQTLGYNSIEIIIAKNMFKSYNELSKKIQRLGAIYLTDNNGKDLLINDNNQIKERIPLSDIISGSIAGVNEKRQPIITLQIKNEQKWNNIIENLKQSQENTKSQQLYIWTDIGQIIDDLRNDITNIKAIATLFNVDIYNKVSSSDWTNIYKIFNIEYYDTGTSQLCLGNLLDLALRYPISQVKTWMKDSKLRFIDVPIELLLINPNDKKSVSNKFIDPLRMYLEKIINYNNSLTETYKQNIINWNSIKTGVNTSKKSNEILTSTETEARQISNLINGGLSGLEFIIRGYRDIFPVISKNIFKILIIILGILILIIFLIILLYNRLFGIITIITIIFTIILTLYFSTLLNIEISPESIILLIIIFGFLLEWNLLFFLHYKRERYKNKVPFELSIKISNKQTTNTFIDSLIILIIIGLSLFWIGENNIKSFATILLLCLITTFIMFFTFNQLMYYLIAKLRWQEKYRWLDISNFSIWTIFIKKQKEKINKKNIKIDFSSTKIIENNNTNIVIDPLIIEKKLNFITIIKNKIINYKNNQKLLFFNIIKLTQIIGIILIIIALIIGFSKKANIANSIKPGVNITINEELWGTDGTNLISDDNAIKTLKTQLNNQKIHNNFSFDIYIIKKQENGINNRILVISTNITKGTFERKLLSIVAAFYNAIPTDPSLTLQQTEPIMGNYILKNTIISLLIGIICIFIYSLFRLDWTQFFGIIYTTIFTLAISIAIAINIQLLITFEMSIAFLIIFCFTITFTTITMILIKQNKKIIDINEYNIFFTYMKEYYSKIKYLRNNHKLFFKKNKKELNKLSIKYPYLKEKELKKKYHKELYYLKLNMKNIKNKNYKIINNINKKFKIYNNKYGFLRKIANITFKQILKHSLILGTIFMLFLIIIASFSGIWFSFNIIVLIGIIIGMFATLFIAIPIWVTLEKYHILNKIRIKKYLNSQYIKIDEQIITGIND